MSWGCCCGGKKTVLAGPASPAATSTAESFYQVATDRVGDLAFMAITNTTGGSVNAKVYLEDDGANSPGAQDEWFDGSLNAGETKIVPLMGYPMKASGRIHIEAASTSVVFRLIGAVRKA